MAKLAQYLEDHVVNQAGEKIDWETISGPGKIIGLYYSAHWCPPCKMFTPKLAEYYKKMKPTDKGKDFEIIFVSSDKDEEAFAAYYKEMPWLALKFDNRQAKAELSKKHGVRGIPTLVLINGDTGETITTKGREKVTSEPDNFPWYPENFSQILYTGDFIKKDGTTVKCDEVKSKIKAVYFSAHWCPPCRGFTPQLIKTYNKLKEEGKNFEIIFASSDRDQASFDEYFGEMPWLALPFGDKRKEKLSDHCNVSGIPTLAIFDENDVKITLDGRSSVGADPEGKDFPWRPKPLNELNEDSAGPINEKACLVYFTDGKPANVEAAKTMLQPIAEKEFKMDQDEQQLLFFYTAEADDLIDSLKSFAKLKATEPFLAVINIPDETVTEFSGDLNQPNVEKFVADFIAGKLESRPLSG